MDRKTADILNKMTSAFYMRNAESFSQTRQNPWKGWLKLADFLSNTKVFASNKPIRVLDVACGNLRFENHLTEAFPKTQFEFTALDNCMPLASNNPPIDNVRFIECDLVTSILDGTFDNHIEDEYDLIVSFGFMHHIPGSENRLSFVRSLSSKLSNNAILALSLWRFMEDKRIARKAQATTETVLLQHPQLSLERNDFFLGWKDTQETYRYCHHFDDAEIDELASLLEDTGKTTTCYIADGRTENLNAYLIAKNH